MYHRKEKPHLLACVPARVGTVLPQTLLVCRPDFCCNRRSGFTNTTGSVHYAEKRSDVVSGVCGAALERRQSRNTETSKRVITTGPAQNRAQAKTAQYVQRCVCCMGSTLRPEVSACGDHSRATNRDTSDPVCL